MACECMLTGRMMRGCPDGAMKVAHTSSFAEWVACCSGVQFLSWWRSCTLNVGSMEAFILLGASDCAATIWGWHTSSLEEIATVHLCDDNSLLQPDKKMHTFLQLHSTSNINACKFCTINQMAAAAMFGSCHFCQTLCLEYHPQVSPSKISLGWQLSLNIDSEFKLLKLVERQVWMLNTSY